MDQVRTLLGQNVIDIPTARNLALATRSGRLQAEKRDDVSRVSVEDLLVVRVGGSTNGGLLGGVAQVLDM